MLSICRSRCVMFRRSRTTKKFLSQCMSLATCCDVPDESIHE